MLHLARLPLAAVLGLIGGSFLNVCVYRLPRGESIAFPSSYCPHCHHPLAWHDLVPLLSFVWLRGHCRYCHRPIALHYPLLELGNAALWFLAALLTEDPAEQLLKQTFTSLLLALSVIDIQHLVIPDELNLAIAALGLTALLLRQALPWWEHLLGLTYGGGILLGIAMIAGRIRQRPSLGGGDIKLMAASGLLLGNRLILIALCLAPFIALVFLTAMWFAGYKISRGYPIPFGPALALACLISCYWGDELVALYFRLF